MEGIKCLKKKTEENLKSYFDYICIFNSKHEKMMFLEKHLDFFKTLESNKLFFNYEENYNLIYAEDIPIYCKSTL